MLECQSEPGIITRPHNTAITQYGIWFGHMASPAGLVLSIAAANMVSLLMTFLVCHPTELQYTIFRMSTLALLLQHAYRLSGFLLEMVHSW